MEQEENIKEKVRMMFVQMSKIDFTPLFELDRQLSANPSLRSEFVKDPLKVAEIYGFKLPDSLKEEGFHLRCIDTDNRYYPSEKVPLSNSCKRMRVKYLGQERKSGLEQLLVV
ncbi:hypothetical protein [Sulfolobus acidocaldarius]|nr:hypothetical protein [Sulfolobus acidocaldarius]AGE70463.1 hypothetical protein SacN8_02415 [Sulfolobus acidocaldarius N8]WCM34457.1 hypothetical protein GO597_03420 [Sulfolobus acidocaldarius DSM 639]